MPSHCYLVLLVLFLPLFVDSRQYINPWNPVDPSDPNDIRVAKWAVSEYNKNATKKLVFERLVSGRKTFASGYIYEIVIAAKNATLPNDPPSYYEADLWARFVKTSLGGFHKLKKTHE